MNVLGLDLGLNTGWATFKAGRADSGAQDFNLRRDESSGRRYLRFNAWLEEIGADVDLIGYEKPCYRGGAASEVEVAAGFSTRVQEYCARRGILCAAVPTATLRRSKRRMIVEFRRRFERDPDEGAEANALYLLSYLAADLRAAIVPTPSQVMLAFT